MAFDVFMKIDSIPGESLDDRHKDWIEILSYNLGVSQPHTADPAAGTTEKPLFQDFTVVKEMDKASPKLWLTCAKGEHLPSVSIQLHGAGRDRSQYMFIKMEDVIVTSVRPGGSTGGSSEVPVEEVSLNYSKIEFVYTPQDPSGSVSTPVTAKWDVRLNQGG